jgi:ESCRT-I complex subunit TSG101
MSSSYYQPQPGSQNKTVKALLWNLNYKYKVEVEKKCAELMMHTSINKASAQMYRHKNGAQQTLLQISGTLPISYRKAQYNIPITFWIPQQFPERPPFCYVVPTESMDIKASHKYMDKQGFIYHPYLSNWSMYSSNLIALSTNLQSVFSKDPPVFAKVSKPRPKPVQPPSYGNPGQPPSYHNAFNAYNRSLNQANPYAQPGARAGPGNYAKPPGYPGQGSQPGAASYAKAGPPSYNEISNVKQSPPSYDQISLKVENPGGGPLRSACEKDELTKKVRTKLQDELMKLHERWAKEVNELQRLQTDLQRSKQEIETEKTGIERETNELKKLKGELEEANVKIESWLDENKDNPPLDLLTTVEPENVWTKQLIEAVAQDSAIDDTLYCLDRALGEDSITFKNYLKQVRKLTREQFFKRALTQKIVARQKQLRERSGRSPHYQPWGVDLS